MKMIEVEDHIFTRLETASNLTKIPIPHIVTQLVLSASDVGTKSQQAAPQLDVRDQLLMDYVNSPAFLARRSVVEKFLGVLSFLHKQNSSQFSILEAHFGGRSRKYLAKTRQELEARGTSVNPKQIPMSIYWVVTNNDTENKKQLVEKALTLLAYGPQVTKVVKDSIHL